MKQGYSNPPNTPSYTASLGQNSCTAGFVSDPNLPDDFRDPIIAQYFTPPAGWTVQDASGSSHIGTQAEWVEKVLRDAIDAQVAYDGSHATISEWEAGYFSRKALTDPRVDLARVRAARSQVPMCAALAASGSGDDATFAATYAVAASQATAFAQGIPSPDLKATDAYYNTLGYVFQFFGKGAILHEALHNLTGLDDDELERFVGKPVIPGVNAITRKLQELSCVPDPLKVPH
jgi:hypothetical protein